MDAAKTQLVKCHAHRHETYRNRMVSRATPFLWALIKRFADDDRASVAENKRNDKINNKRISASNRTNECNIIAKIRKFLRNLHRFVVEISSGIV